MDSNGSYILNPDPPKFWSRVSNFAAPITPLLQTKKKYEVLKQNAFSPPLSIKTRAPLTTTVRIGNVVYPVQAELYAGVLAYLQLNPPLTLAKLKTAINNTRAELNLPASVQVQMSRLPKMLDNHPRRTYLAGGSNWLQTLVPKNFPINFKLSLVYFPLLANFENLFLNQKPIAIYNISFIADDGVTWLTSLVDLFKNKSGRQIISNSDWKTYLKENRTLYKRSLIIVKPYTIDIYGGIYPAKLGFIFAHNPFGNSADGSLQSAINLKLYVVVMQGLVEMYKRPYPANLEAGFQYLADDLVTRKEEINMFLKSYNFNDHVNYKLLKGGYEAPQLA